ncbi:hypothetical protein [Litorivita sp. NS0012-18]|uniref:hypothetical protein n=1 Tax=Litorivita sp. NS0012-18 TaxID=3127655 RepID=UPI003103B78B
MFGVVLWSDTEDQKAVIWCEDHGDLAFYNAGQKSCFDGVSLDAGDLVQFEVDTAEATRIARNPRLVAEGQYPTLAADLAGKGAAAAAPAPKPVQETPAASVEGNVVAFRPAAGGSALARRNRVASAAL